MIGTVENTGGAVAVAGRDASAGAGSSVCPLCGHSQVDTLLEAPDRFHLRKELYRLLRCSSCNSVWLSNPPRPEEMWLHYTEDYHEAIVAAGEGFAVSRWKDQVKLIRAYKTGGSILDIGCSSGGFLSTMKNEAWQLHGIEMEESTAERARANTGANVFVGQAMEAPFFPASFDVITCFDVLEHVYDPRQFLTKVRQWLKPGGIFYAMMPNIDSWESKVFGNHWFGLELPRHLWHFSPRSLRYLMTEVGLSEVSVRTPVVSYVERSSQYVFSTVMESIGLTPRSQARPKPAGLTWKIARKGIRMGLIRPIAQAASLARVGPCLEVVFANALS